MTTSEELQISGDENSSVSLDINSVVESCLTRTTNASLKRSSDIRNDKSKVVFDFFNFCGKSVEAVLPNNVEEWCWNLKTQKLADGTIYNRISALAQFYEYLRNDVGMMKLIPNNPARVSLPKASKPFQSESVKALSREELGRLLDVVANHTTRKQPVHLKDYAILQFYVATGRCRAEIISLRGNSIEIKDGRFFIKARVKGGFFLNFELDEETTRNALFDYLTVTNRTDIFGQDKPLRLRHDKGAGSSKNKRLTSRGFVRTNLVIDSSVFSGNQSPSRLARALPPDKSISSRRRLSCGLCVRPNPENVSPDERHTTAPAFPGGRLRWLPRIL